MAQDTAYQPPSNLKSRLKESYDAIAPHYNEWTAPHFSDRLAFLDQFLPNLLKKDGPVSILELGCGCGLPVSQKILSHPSISITANDLSSTQIALAKKNLSNEGGDRVTFIEGDMLKLNLPPQSFDGVVAFYSIIHLPRDEQVTLLQHIAKWLKPGGYFLANFASQDMPGSEMENWLKEEKGWMFWSGWGTEGTVKKVKEAGFEIMVSDVLADVVDDASFLWVIARKT